MNPVELLRFYGVLCGLSAAAIRQRTDELLGLVGLSEARRKPLRQFSKGMLQRAGIAQALLHDPDLLVLDEPTTGLDPLARLQMRDLILKLRSEGKTVFFSSHELSEAEMICDRVGVLHQGQLRWCGPTAELAGDGERNLERVFLRLIQPGGAASTCVR
jgi:ABC-2 type transport system ATP-binding protein